MRLHAEGMSTGALVQALGPPGGLVEVSMSPPSSPATQRAVDGHEIARTAPMIGIGVGIHALVPPVGLVDAITPE